MTRGLPKVVLAAALPRKVRAVKEHTAQGPLYFVRGDTARGNSRGFKSPAAFARFIRSNYPLKNPPRSTQTRTVVSKPAPRATVAGVPAAARRPPVGAQLVYLVRGPGGRIDRLIGSTTNPKRKTAMAQLARNRKGQFVKRRNPSAYVANPRKRRKKHHRKAAAAPAAKARRRRKTSAARKPSSHYRAGGGPRRYPYTVTFRKPNPRRRRRARNPSFGGVMSTIKTTLPPMLLGGAAGLGAGFIDAKFLGDKPTISLVSKLSLALLGAAVIGRRHPMAAAGFAGGMMGSTGYRYGVKFGGGLVGLSPSGTLKGLADMAADNPEMAATIAGLGDIVEAPALGDGDATEEYAQALADSDDEMADIVEAE